VEKAYDHLIEMVVKLQYRGKIEEMSTAE